MDDFVKRFDGIGWIPSIKGCFSLNAVAKMPEFSYGDFDKYSIVFTKNDSNTREKHYFIASTVVKTDDTKGGSRYGRLYRCIFIGAVGDDDLIKSDEFYKEKYDYILNEDICIGKLLLYFVDDAAKYDDKENEFLHKLDEFSALFEKNKNIDDYYDKWSKLNDMFDELSEVVHNRKNNFLEEILYNLKDELVINKNVYDIALCRDGLMFIKKRNKHNKNMNTVECFELSQEYQLAFLFLKHVFHSDYHHSRSCDDILQIFSCKNKMKKFYSAQLSLLLDVVVDAKKFLKTSVNVEPQGILSYAKSFVSICKNKNIISSNEEEYQYRLINNLSNEMNIHSATRDRYYNKWFFDGGMLKILIMYIMPVMIASITFLGFYGTFFERHCRLLIQFISMMYDMNIFINVINSYCLYDVLIRNTAFIVVNLFLMFAFFSMYNFAQYRYNRYSKKAQLDNQGLIKHNKYKSVIYDKQNFKYRINYRYLMKYWIENIWYIIATKFNINVKIFKYGCYMIFYLILVV